MFDFFDYHKNIMLISGTYLRKQHHAKGIVYFRLRTVVTGYLDIGADQGGLGGLKTPPKLQCAT